LDLKERLSKMKLEKINNEELHKLYSSYVIRNMRWAEHIARMAEKINAFTVLVGKPE
jgi:hypothetical protein